MTDTIKIRIRVPERDTHTMTTMTPAKIGAAADALEGGADLHPGALSHRSHAPQHVRDAHAAWVRGVSVTDYVAALRAWARDAYWVEAEVPRPVLVDDVVQGVTHD